MLYNNLPLPFISRRHCDSVTAAWLIGHLKPGPPAIYPFHTRLFIHSLKQDKGSRLPELNRLSLKSKSIIVISQP